ncbi:hypothetical protein EBT16_13290, partial [bacterium]|nr:hypothetical protein [bacterium]
IDELELMDFFLTLSAFGYNNDNAIEQRKENEQNQSQTEIHRSKLYFPNWKPQSFANSSCWSKTHGH